MKKVSKQKYNITFWIYTVLLGLIVLQYIAKIFNLFDTTAYFRPMFITSFGRVLPIPVLMIVAAVLIIVCFILLLQFKKNIKTAPAKALTCAIIVSIPIITDFVVCFLILLSSILKDVSFVKESQFIILLINILLEGALSLLLRSCISELKGDKTNKSRLLR